MIAPREATRRARERHPFHIAAFVVFPRCSANSARREWRNKAIAPYDMLHELCLAGHDAHRFVDRTQNRIKLVPSAHHKPRGRDHAVCALAARELRTLLDAIDRGFRSAAKNGTHGPVPQRVGRNHSIAPPLCLPAACQITVDHRGSLLTDQIEALREVRRRAAPIPHRRIVG